MTRSLAGRLIGWASAAATLPFCWACQSYRLAEPDPRPQRVLEQQVSINPPRQLDVVFLIDNSISMKDEQASLVRNFPLFMQELAAANPLGLPDLHIGVISSDLGDRGNACKPLDGDGGGFRNQPRGNDGKCTAVPRDPYIIAGPAGNNFTGPIADVFSCIAELGTKGCGFEHQLAALRRALGKDPVAPMPPENAGFLRPGARLGIVLITDEDDCSAPADSDLFRKTDQLLTDPYGPQQSFRCNEYGHLCAGNAPPRREGVTLTGCRSNESATSKLVHVSEFVASILSLKPDPNQIVVAAISGPTGPYRIVSGTQSDQLPYLEVAAACRRGLDEFGASPALRIHEFASAFPKHVTHSICSDDFASVMRDVGRLIGQTQPACVGGRVVDRDVGTAGLQPECAVTQIVPRDTGTPLEALVPSCAANGHAPPCWFLQVNPADCPVASAPQSLELQVDRGGALPPEGARLRYSCVVCAGGDEPGCAASP